jgi:hypothetical protein
VIQYQNAAKIDPRYGPAHYKLGGVYLKLKPPAVALNARDQLEVSNEHNNRCAPWAS